MSQPELKRDLGPAIAIAVVVGDVIGSGIFLKPGTIAAEAGNFWLIISLWVLGGVLCILGGLCYAELGTMFPRAGGLYVYLKEAFGTPVGFLFGWAEFIFNKPASIGALAVAFVISLNSALGWKEEDVSAWEPLALATTLVVGLSVVNYLGVIWGGRMQLATTVVKAGFVAFIAVLPFAMWPFTESVELANFSSTISPRQATLSLQISAVLLGVMWAYNGWHGITPLAEEVRDPQRNIPLALLGGIGILMVLYVGANIAYHAVLPMSELAAAKDRGAEEMLGRLLGKAGVSTMAAVIMCSTFGAINSTILQTPRIAFAMARDRVFFQSLGKVHATYRTPAPAILVLAVMSIGLIAAAGLGRWLAQGVDPASFPGALLPKIVESLQNNTIFGLLTNFVIFSASIFYTLGVLAVIVLRWRQPNTERPYRTLGYPLTPLLFIAVYVWFLYQVYWSNPLEAHTGLVAIAAGLPFYFGYRWWVGRSSG